MSPRYHAGLHRYAIFVAVCTFLLLIAGALVTSNDAALSVPDWPLSYGTLTPPMVGGIVYEHSHRVIAATVGLFTIILAVWTWTAEERRWLRWLSLAALGAVIAQGILGGLTVMLNLHYGMPVAHACLAQIFFGTVVGIALFTSRWWITTQPQLTDIGSPSVHRLALFNAGVIFVQVIFGAGFRHRDIPIWPHVVGAFAVTATVTWTAIVLRRRFSASRQISRVRLLLHSIFGVQFVLGLAAWWSRLTTADAPQPMLRMIVLTVTHTVAGALTFACAVAVVLLCYRLVPRGGEAVEARRAEAALS
ncbi:MAG: COX15/CtaA family protein [Acidobacteriia bacterium]|nr:COX15/CtaA family protein [Terriglobia bacterium]